MSEQGKSTPKMRRAFTPRVKSAQNINHLDIKKPLFFSDKKEHNNPSFNPQKFQDPVAKKLNLNLSPQKPGKIDIAHMHTDTGSPIKKNNYLSNAHHVGPAQNKPARQLQGGRNLQWPVNDQKGQQMSHENENRQGKIPRCMSAHTIKSAYTSRSERTDKIKQSKKQFNQKFGVAFNYLLGQNTPYFNEKISMCNQKARPWEETFKVQRPNFFTTNKDFYKVNTDKHRLDIDPQNEKMSLFLSPSKVCGNSTTQQFHKGQHGKRADLAQWSEGFKLQGPICQVTTSSNAFPNHGEYQKMVPIAVWNEHPLGMKHRQSSTNSRLMKGEFAPRAELAKWNNLNPIANDLFNPKNGTKYKTEFGQKQKQPIQQWPLAEHKLIVTDGKFSTEMKTSHVDFNTHELNVENKCNCGRKRH